MRRSHFVYLAILFTAVSGLCFWFCRPSPPAEKLDASFGLYEPEERQISTKEQKFYDDSYLAAVSESAGFNDDGASLLDDLIYFSNLKNPPCGLRCSEFAVKIQRAGRGQISGVLENEAAQRLSAKAQLESILETTMAARIPEWVKMEIRVRLREAFLPPSLPMVRAALFEMNHRKEPQMKPNAEEKTLSPREATNLFLKRALLLTNEYSPTSHLTEPEIQHVLIKGTAFLDILEGQTDTNTYLWAHAGEIKNHFISKSIEMGIPNQIKLKLMEALIYARGADISSLKEIAAYAPMYHLE